MMCHVTGLAASYVPANICNGFILYASSDGCWPLFVCNPVTGENIKIPPAPAPPPYVEVERTQYVFAMGFSASTGQYKLFRLPFGNPKTVGNNYLDVHTLGSGGGGWRRHPELFRYHGFGSPPVLVGDKLYVLIKPDVYSRMPDMILVIDVTSEAYHRYHLMPNNNECFVVAMDVLELGGQPCVAVHVLDLHDHAKITLHIWAMPTPKLVQEGQQKKLHERLPGEWELRYSFYGDMPDNYSFNDEMRAVWVEDDATLCCIMSDRRYQSDTTNIHKDKSKCKVGSLAWNHQLQLPSPPDDLFRRRSINGGYRPTLLSPRDLIVEQHDLAAQRFDNSWLCALRYQRPGKRNGSPCSDHDGDDQHAAKRIHP
jgi:F-box interacting protein